MNNHTLRYNEHSRHFNDYCYVYPVVSRRSEGVSLGINLNVNNACNWRCVYCQVEGLVRGKPERVDLALLERELEHMLKWLVDGDFLSQYAPPGLQRFNDICLSGNGEPSLSEDLVAVCEIIQDLRRKFKLGNKVKTILISNGSEVHKSPVQQSLAILAANNGELWFKIDRATSEGISQVNQVHLHLDGIVERLRIAAAICPTFIQSCWFKTAELDPSASEVEQFVKLILRIKTSIQGVLLYSTVRNPALLEGHRISQIDNVFLVNLAQMLSSHGVNVKYYQ